MNTLCCDVVMILNLIPLLVALEQARDHLNKIISPQNTPTWQYNCVWHASPHMDALCNVCMSLEKEEEKKRMFK